MREIFLALTRRYGVDQGRRLTDTILLEATFGAPLNLTFDSLARRVVRADASLTGGANAQTICAAMTVRQILPVGECNQPPHGEVTWYTSADTTIQISDPRPIDALDVEVAIDGVPRGDLQIALIAPDGTRVVLQNPSADRTLGLHATYGVSTLSVEPLEIFHGRSAAGIWKLDVAGSADAVLVSWALAIHFVGDDPFVTRPLVSARRNIAAVAHVAGLNGTNYISDVQLFNNGSRTANVMTIFTRTGSDGTIQFGAVNVVVAPQHVVILNDVVTSVMQSTVTGQLEFSGDIANLVIHSRTYTTASHGTYGESIPSSTDGLVAGDIGTITLLRSTADFRSNIGFAEVAGGSGVVRFRYVDLAGITVGASDYPVVPFTHFQTALLVNAAAMRADVTVRGSAKVLAYGSVVDNRSGDGIYIPAARPLAEDAVVPAAHSAGINGTFWRTDLWTPTGVREDVVTTTGPLFINEPLAGSRTWTASENGTFGEFIAPIPISSGIRSGETLQLIGIEQSSARRTNVGVINVDRASPVGVQLVAYDAAGFEKGRLDVGIGAGQMSQIPLSAITGVALQIGRVSATVISATGAAVAYASVVDNRSGDPYVVIGQH
jgi:subtilisin-like proprotein convertase family protein